MLKVLLNFLLALLSAVLLAMSFPLTTPRIMLPFTEELGLGPYMLPGLPLTADYLQYGWLAFVALVPLLLLAWRASGPAAAFRWGYFSGVLWLALSWGWLGSFGAVPVVLLSAFFALPVGLFAWLAYWVAGSRQPGLILWGLPAAWAGLEYLRGFGFWAFPWNLLGYSQTHDLPLLQLAELGGVFMVSFAVVLANAALFLLLVPLEPRGAVRRRPVTDRGAGWDDAPAAPEPDLYRRAALHRRYGHALCGVAVLLVAHAYGLLRLWQLDAAQAHVPRVVRVGLAQGGINTKESWSQPGVFERSLLAYTIPGGSAMVNWTREHPAQPLPPPIPLVGPFLPGDGHPPRPALPQLRQGVRQPTAAGEAAPAAAWHYGAQRRGAPASAPPGVRALPQRQPRVWQPGFTATPDNPAYLLVWPESCIPRRVEQPLNAFVPGEVQGLVQGRDNCGLLYGAAGHPHSRERYENGALLVTAPGPELAWVYSKARLVPYGEVVPFRGIVRFLSYPWGDEDISEGRTIEPFSFAGHKLGVQVCYDNQFGFISRSSARQGAEALLLVTNNSWYDLPSGIRQHCDIDQLRAIETRRALGRSSTTGWTQLVLPSGRIAASSKLNKQDMVEQWLPLSTAQSVYSITGDIFAQLCAVAGMVLGAGVVLAGRSEGWL